MRSLAEEEVKYAKRSRFYRTERGDRRRGTVGPTHKKKKRVSSRTVLYTFLALSIIPPSSIHHQTIRLGPTLTPVSFRFFHPAPAGPHFIMTFPAIALPTFLYLPRDSEVLTQKILTGPPQLMPLLHPDLRTRSFFVFLRDSGR